MSSVSAADEQQWPSSLDRSTVAGMVRRPAWMVRYIFRAVFFNISITAEIKRGKVAYAALS